MMLKLNVTSQTLDTQGLLDPSDSSLDFVSKRENVRPIAIYRVEENFLLCYAEFAFYVNKTGWRARPKWGIQWEGYPTSFGKDLPPLPPGADSQAYHDDLYRPSLSVCPGF